jgi:hypothetical protein
MELVGGNGNCLTAAPADGTREEVLPQDPMKASLDAPAQWDEASQKAAAAQQSDPRLKDRLTDLRIVLSEAEAEAANCVVPARCSADKEV